jgi:hypothetical protein
MISFWSGGHSIGRALYVGAVFARPEGCAIEHKMRVIMLSILDPFLFHLLVLKIINFPPYSFKEVALVLDLLLNGVQEVVVVLGHV